MALSSAEAEGGATVTDTRALAVEVGGALPLPGGAAVPVATAAEGVAAVEAEAACSVPEGETVDCQEGVLNPLPLAAEEGEASSGVGVEEPLPAALPLAPPELVEKNVMEGLPVLVGDTVELLETGALPE